MEEHFAVSSHRSALDRLGFAPTSITAVPRGAVRIYTVTGRGLVETSTLDLQSFASPSTPVIRERSARGQVSPLEAEINFSLAVKRMVGRVLRDPQNARRSHAGKDAPRFFRFFVTRPSCEANADLLTAVLANLPLASVVYIASPDGSTLQRTRLGGGMAPLAERSLSSEMLDPVAAGTELLAKAEP